MQAGKHPYFDAAEFSGRIARLRARMRQAGVDVALFDEIEAMTWLSGFGNSENRWRCVGVPLEGEPFFLIRALDASPCRQRTWITDVPTFRDWEDPMPVLAAALAKRGLQGAKIGLDFGSYCMPLARFARLREALPDAQFVDLGNVIWELRLTKSPAEIALLRRAAGVADRGHGARRCRMRARRLAARRGQGRRRGVHRTGRRSQSTGADLGRPRLGFSARASRGQAARRWRRGAHRIDAARVGLQRAADALRGGRNRENWKARPHCSAICRTARSRRCSRARSPTMWTRSCATA